MLNEDKDDSSAMRALLVAAHHEVLNAVGGRLAVARYLRDASSKSSPTHALAVGKAAADMMEGAFDVLGDALEQTLVITKHGHAIAGSRARVIESAHPLPDESCLHAGAELWDFITRAPHDARVLLMISGGASALAEHLAVGLDAKFMARVNAWLLGSGLAIGAMNRVRKRISRIKGGRLAIALNGRQTLLLMISDVPLDDAKIIGSGPLTFHTEADIEVADLALPSWLTQATTKVPPLAPLAAFECISAHIIAHPQMAKTAAANSLREHGVAVYLHHDLLEGDALERGAHIVEVSKQDPGVIHLWSSETTVILPPSPGRGGRCQSLALSAALALAAGDAQAVVLAAGTDGSDGPGFDAGAVVDAHSVARGRQKGRDPLADLGAADAGSFLEASGDLLRTGPTGTNVMDLLMAWTAP
jgi:glycerate 2-kinase